MLQRVSPSLPRVKIGVFTYIPDSGEIAHGDKKKVLPKGEHAIFNMLFCALGKVVGFAEIGFNYQKSTGTFPSFYTIKTTVDFMRFRLSTLHPDGKKYIHAVIGKGFALITRESERERITKANKPNAFRRGVVKAYDKLYMKHGRPRKKRKRGT